MKVAVCLSGHLRNCCFEHLKDLDVYLCTWNHCNFNFVNRVFDESIMRRVHEKRYEIVSKYAKYNHPHKNRAGWESYANFFLMHQCNLLRKESGKQYDLVIRFRPDYRFYIGDLSQLKKDVIYFPDNANYMGITDNFAIGSPDVMDDFFNIYQVMDVYTMLESCKWVNEHIVKHHLDRLGIKHEKLPGMVYLNCDGSTPGGDQKMPNPKLL